MNKVVVVVLLFATVVVSDRDAPVPSPYGTIARRHPTKSKDDSKIVDQRLLNRVADIYSQGGDGSEDEQENEGPSVVSSELLERIMRIISQNEAQTSGSAPAAEGKVLATEYGVPADIMSKLVGGGSFELGTPFAAKRIASFHYTAGDEDEGGNVNAPSYNSHNEVSSNSNAYPAQLPSRGGEESSRFQFVSAPQKSERISAFSVPDVDHPSSAYGAPERK